MHSVSIISETISWAILCRDQQWEILILPVGQRNSDHRPIASTRYVVRAPLNVLTCKAITSYPWNTGRSNFRNYSSHISCEDSITIWVRALTAVMHLGLINGHFMPRSLISAKVSPVTCQSSRWPPDLTLNVFWFQWNEPIYALSFSLKNPIKLNPTIFPNRNLYE